MKKWLILLLPLMLFAKEEVVIKVAEMHCPMCTTAVKKALKSVEGVESSKVTLETKLAVVIAKDGVEDMSVSAWRRSPRLMVPLMRIRKRHIPQPHAC